MAMERTAVQENAHHRRRKTPQCKRIPDGLPSAPVADAAVVVIFRPVRHHFQSRAAGFAGSSPIRKKPISRACGSNLTAKAGLAFPKRLSKAPQRRTIATIGEVRFR
jgi:hypothetical protein